MAGEEWADEPEVPKKKRGLPGWLWFCGGGCLIAIVLAAIGGMFLWNQVKEMADPEKQWEHVGELVVYDARPPGWTIFGLDMFPGVDGFVFMDLGRGRTVNWMILPASESEARDEIFGEDFDGGGIPNVNKVEDTESGEVVVQGRTMPVLRFTQTTFGTGKQICAFVDITPEDTPELWLLQIVLPPGSERVSDEFISEFLAPFHLGPDHVTYVPGASDEPEGIITELGLPEETTAPEEVPIPEDLPEQDDE